MAIKKKVNKKSSSKQNNLLLVAVVSLVVVSIVCLLLMACRVNDTTRVLNRYRGMAATANTACQGLAGAIDVKGMKVGLNVNEAKHPVHVANFYCFTGPMLEQQTIQGKTVPAYPMGAKVWYLKNAAEAKKFGETFLNPMRYWGVDQAGQAAGIPQSSLFTFIVSEPNAASYFDAYTVRGNAAMRVSLPCKTSQELDSVYNVEDCQTRAEDALKNLAETVRPDSTANTQDNMLK